MENGITVTARVRVVLDIPSDGRWGDDCPVWQVHKQAVESVVGLIRNAGKLGELLQAGRVLIVGEPEPVMVTTERGR